MFINLADCSYAGLSSLYIYIYMYICTYIFWKIKQITMEIMIQAGWETYHLLCSLKLHVFRPCFPKTVLRNFRGKRLGPIVAGTERVPTLFKFMVSTLRGYPRRLRVKSRNVQRSVRFRNMQLVLQSSTNSPNKGVDIYLHFKYMACDYEAVLYQAGES